MMMFWLFSSQYQVYTKETKTFLKGIYKYVNSKTGQSMISEKTYNVVIKNSATHNSLILYTLEITILTNLIKPINKHEVTLKDLIKKFLNMLMRVS